MKKYEFYLSKPYLDLFFPKKRIKSKVEIIQILLEATRFMLVNPTVGISTDKVEGKIVLYVDKMSRLFLSKEKKYYSIVFPFHTYDDGESVKFLFKSNKAIDSRLISKVISIITCDKFQEKCSLDFISPIYDYEEDHDENFWVFLREILLSEDGYIRYDYDEAGYGIALENGEEHRHPLHHYDLFYTNNATFKVGLHGSITESDFYDLLNVKSECKYLSSYHQ
jgi:hypothetical protein